MPNRPSIPKAMQRNVLVEAGHRCAIPTCRSMAGLHLHHIIPWSKCKRHKENNLIALCPNCHFQVHQGNIDAKSLRMYKANLQRMSDVYTPLEIDILFECDKSGGVPFTRYLLILVKRLIDSGLIRLHYQNVGIIMGSVDTSPCIIRLTDTGRQYVDCLKSCRPCQ